MWKVIKKHRTKLYKFHTHYLNQSSSQDKALQVPHPLFESVFLTGQNFTSSTLIIWISLPHRTKLYKFHTHYLNQSSSQDKALQVPHPLFESVFLTGQSFTSSTPIIWISHPHRTKLYKFHTHYLNQSSSQDKALQVPHPLFESVFLRATQWPVQNNPIKLENNPNSHTQKSPRFRQTGLIQDATQINDSQTDQ